MSEIIDFQSAHQARQNKKLAAIDPRIPGLVSAYKTKREVIVQELNKVHTFIAEFEEKNLCFSNKEKIPAMLLNAYANGKALTLHLEIILQTLDESIRKYCPDFNPNS